jgi:hypothetical protein
MYNAPVPNLVRDCKAWLLQRSLSPIRSCPNYIAWGTFWVPPFRLASDRDPEVPAGTVGIWSRNLGNALEVFAASEYGFARFNISLPKSVSPPHRFGLTFKLLQWHWELTSITLPESIQSLLADELAKSTKVPARKL